MEIPVTIELKTVNCTCGVIYAVPRWLVSFGCPKCLYQRLNMDTSSMPTDKAPSKDKRSR